MSDGGEGVGWMFVRIGLVLACVAFEVWLVWMLWP
jgi:hypothetical protein